MFLCRNLQLAQAQLFLFSLSIFFTPVCSRLVNITVDDLFGDPTTGQLPRYSGREEDEWNAGSPSENCTHCAVSPAYLDLNQVYKQTWHDSSYIGDPLLSMTVQFTGSAVYVFNILPNTLPIIGTSSQLIVNADIIIHIDGEEVFHFARRSDYTSTVLYNFLLYSNTSLDHGPHTLIMTPGGSSESSPLLFDYLIYTTESDDTTSTVSSVIAPHGSSQSPAQPSPSPPQFPGTNSGPPRSGSSSTTRVGALVGAVLGASALLLGVGVGVFFLCRRHKRQRATPTQVGPEDALRHENDYGGNGEYEGREADGAFLEQHMVDVSQTTTISPSLPGQFVNGANTHNHLNLISDRWQLCRQDSDSALPHTSILATFAASSARPSSMVQDQSSKHREALTQRLDALHRTRSILSSQAPSDSRGSRSEVSSSEGAGPGTEAAMRALEAEISQLRGILAAMNVRFVDVYDDNEPLPAYTE